ncbi:MAG: carboxyl-terminal protease [Saprospirales bacterium]|nr:carboxyl-terminal protease [Saprospirales bacterium]
MLTASTTVLPPSGNYFEIAKNIEIFTNLYKEVNTYYVDETNPSSLMKTGIDAMLASLDPYTNYFSESQIEGWRYITEGKYNGIGADIRIIDGRPTIVAPFENAPAFNAGLKAGDQILEIDGQDTEGKTSEDVGAILKGYPGTEVKLKVKRPGEKKTIDLTLVRDEVNIPNVPYSDMISEDVGYIALTTFTRDAGRNVANALKDLKVEQPNLKGVVLDLRDNGGGLLAEAVNVVNVFVPKGELVVSTKGKVKDWNRSFKTLNAPVDDKVPLIVLINKGSASASEIVSGTIQDLDRGVLIGQRSYGKGLVQNTRDVGYNAKVKMTTAKYYIPSGRCIQSLEYHNGEPAEIPDEKRAKFKTRNGRIVLDGGGVKPDIVIDLDDETDILETLEENNIIFNYVTQWVLRNPELTELDNFHFEEWDDFVKYLEARNFDFDTETEKLLADLREKSVKSGYLSDADFSDLEQRLIANKKSQLEAHKEIITDLIEKEIASRYQYEKGRIKLGLRNDIEIKKAIELFHNPAQYQAILKGEQ